jgi:hypothetical protein
MVALVSALYITVGHETAHITGISSKVLSVSLSSSLFDTPAAAPPDMMTVSWIGCHPNLQQPKLKVL